MGIRLYIRKPRHRSTGQVTHSTTKQTAFKLTKKIWTTLNRIRIDHGKNDYIMFKWGLLDFANDDCGHK